MLVLTNELNRRRQLSVGSINLAKELRRALIKTRSRDL